ncbi:hypothetical protein RCL1_000795 [Eukaryota sp. TZLM3-RCL]
MGCVEDLFDKENLSTYYEDVLTLMLELRPRDPEHFLHEYFKSAISEHSPVQRALRYINLITRPDDELLLNDNCVAAYQSLAVLVLGDIFNSFVSNLFEKFPHSCRKIISKLVSVDPCVVVTYEKFREVVVLYLKLTGLSKYLKILFQVIEAHSFSVDIAHNMLVEKLAVNFSTVNDFEKFCHGCVADSFVPVQSSRTTLTRDVFISSIMEAILSQMDGVIDGNS